jgi:hypothetical protein
VTLPALAENGRADVRYGQCRDALCNTITLFAR